MPLRPHRHGGAAAARLRGPFAGAVQAAEVRQAPADGKHRVRMLFSGVDLHQVIQISGQKFPYYFSDNTVLHIV